MGGERCRSSLAKLFVGDLSRLKESLCSSSFDVDWRTLVRGLPAASGLVGFGDNPPSDGLLCGLGVRIGGGPIEVRPPTLGRDFALEFDVRAVVVGVDVRGEDWPELLS